MQGKEIPAHVFRGISDETNNVPVGDLQLSYGCL
jgi:hypothetical protein